MHNERPIQSPNLTKALDAIRATMDRYDLAGMVMIVAPEEAAYFYKLHAAWSAIAPDPRSPTGFRITVSATADGPERAHAKATGAIHTICQLGDFGEQTVAWMTDLKAMLRGTGMDFDHTPFGGLPIPRLVPEK